MTPPLVSIIIPVFKTEKFVGKCLESIIYQSYNNLEILVINDCSPDDSEKIISQYQKLDNRIKYIKNEKNIGLSATRNKGIESATGEYVMFVDSDDTVHYQMVLDCISLVKKSGSDLVEFGFHIVREGENADLLLKSERTRERHYNLTFNKRYIKKIDREIDHICCNKLFSTEILRTKAIRFKSRYYEDTSFTREYLFNCKSITKTDQKYYNYFIRTDSIMHSEYNVSKIDGLIDSVNSVFYVLEKFGLLSYLSKRYIRLFRRDILTVYSNSSAGLFIEFVNKIGDKKIMHFKLFKSLRIDRFILQKAALHKFLFTLYSMLFIKTSIFLQRFYNKVYSFYPLT